MRYSSAIYKRRSIRLKGYDYSNPGAYFITTCTKNGRCLFCEVVDGRVHLNECGEIVRDEWLKTFLLRKNLILDDYVIMPNHFHGIINICRGTARRAPTGDHTLTARRAPTGDHTLAARRATGEQFAEPVSGSLPTIIRSFKSAVSKRIHEIRGLADRVVWQRNYYEHVIRNERELNRIKEYIQNNPMKWHLDRENPDRVGRDKYEDDLFKPL